MIRWRQKAKSRMEITMAQNTNNTAAAQGQSEEAVVNNTATQQNHERAVKTPKQRNEGVANAKKRALATAAGTRKALKSGAKAFGNGTKSVAREVVADAAGGAVGIITTMVVGNIVNGSLCDAVNIVDSELGKRHPRMVTVKKSFGRRKTMTEGEYYKALTKGKHFKEVETNHFLIDHKQVVDTAVGTVSYAMGAGAGVAAGLTTRSMVKNQLVLNSQINKAVRTALDGSDYEEDGQI